MAQNTRPLDVSITDDPREPAGSISSVSQFDAKGEGNAPKVDDSRNDAPGVRKDSLAGY